MRLKCGLEPRAVPVSEFMCETCQRKARPTPRPQSDDGPLSPGRVVGDPVGNLDERQVKAVAGAFKASRTVCKEKSQCQAAEPVSAEALSFVAERLAKEWREKPGDLLDELAQNLRAPEEVEANHCQALVLAAAAQHLQRTCGASYPGCNAAELLVMALYTMAGPDIDGLMTFPDVPSCEDAAAWGRYAAELSPQRNKAIFSEVNWALRTLADKPKDKEAARAVRKWAKFTALLAAVAARHKGSGLVYRGLAGLPPAVAEAHAAMPVGGTLRWAAPSSTAVDPTVPESYIRGEAVNATKAQEGGAIFFTVRGCGVGVPLQAISKYPKEAEVLLPPFVSFAVTKCQQSLRPQLRGALALELGSPELLCPARALLAEAELAAGGAASRLTALAEEDGDAACSRLERLASRCWQPPEPKPEPGYRKHTGLSASRAQAATGKTVGQLHERACACCGQGLEGRECAAAEAAALRRQVEHETRAREAARVRAVSPDAPLSPQRRRRAADRSLLAICAGLSRSAAEEAADRVLSEEGGAGEGPHVRRWRSGRIEETFSDCTRRIALPSGAVVVRHANGDTQREFSCGKVAYHYKDTNVLHTTHPDGSAVVEFLETGQLERIRADGSKDIIFPNGQHASIPAPPK